MSRYTQYFIAAAVVFLLPFVRGRQESPLQDRPAAPLSEILEVSQFSDILKAITPQSLVLLDIDDTLIEPVQTLGSDVWFRWRIGFYEKKGDLPEIAFEKALMDWVSVQCLTEVKLVEPGIDTIVRRMQEEGFCVMGLTTRGASLATRTVQQLDSQHIHLVASAPYREEVVFLNPREVIYKNGILFTAGTRKGTALFTLLDKIQLPVDQIDRVVFINDKLSHLQDVQKSCREKGLPFLGLRYSFSDQRVHQFSEQVALYQFEKFGQILSDEEAKEELQLLSE